MTQSNTNYVRFTVRMAEHIFNRLKETAEKNKRSVTKEVENEIEFYQKRSNV